MLREGVSRGDRYFEDEQTGAQYRRVVAGLSWPAVKPGFLVVVAEDLNKDHELGIRHFRVLGEGEDLVPKELFRKCLDFRARFKVQDFLADAEDKGWMELVKQFNRNSESGSLHLRNAPLVEDPKCFIHYVMSIRNHFSSDRAFHTLHFDETSKLPDYLKELRPEEVLTAMMLDHPAISALGFAVAYLDTFEPKPPLPPLSELKIPNLAKSYVPKLDYWKKR